VKGGSCEAVDPFFSRVAAGLPSVGWVNLRSNAPEIAPWKPMRE
jgi:hypothetical protein